MGDYLNYIKVWISSASTSVKAEVTMAKVNRYDTEKLDTFQVKEHICNILSRPNRNVLATKRAFAI